MNRVTNLFLLSFSCLVFTGFQAVYGADGQKLAEKEVATAGRLPIEELQLFAEAFHRISTAYVHEVDDRTLLESAIRGMLSRLDPHSTYLDQDGFSSLQEESSGQYGGLGLEVDMESGGLRVIAPMDGTPAFEAGIKTGDLIVAIEDQPVRKMSLADAAEMMRGPPGSQVRLMLVPADGALPSEITLTRDVIEVDSVHQEVLEPGYGYLRIAQFQEGTADEVAVAVDRMLTGNDVKGLVLDLRNNPGGLLRSAVEVSDVFLSDGLIAYTKGRLPASSLRFFASSPDVAEGVPLVVLVNGGTASASEIVAGALQDHRRAVIMGTPTFGKGSVQTVLPLTEDKAIKLTTSLYYTPGGRAIQARGITPDIRVDRSRITRLESRYPQIQERNLRDHIQLDGGDRTDAGAEEADDVSRLAADDYQLHEALTLLKGLNVLARKEAG